MCNSWGSHLKSARLWPTSLFMVIVDPFPHRPGHMQSFHVQVWADKVTTVLLWRPLDHGPYCELLSVDQVRRRSDDSTRSWRQCCQLVEFCGDYVSIREIINNCRETARRAESVKIWPTSAAQLLREKIAIEKGCDNWMTFSVTRGNRNNTPHWNVICHAHASTHHSYSAHHTKFAISSFTISKGMIEFKSKKRVTYATLMMLFGSSLSCQGMWPIVQN